jgi:hypothetical protein
MKNLLMLLLLVSSSVLAKNDLSDSQVKAMMIQDSMASYSGRCPCPYNLASNGSQCGRRSAYSKPGGYAPLCYDTDITAEMVNQYKSRRGL